MNVLLLLSFLFCLCPSLSAEEKKEDNLPLQERLLSSAASSDQKAPFVSLKTLEPDTSLFFQTNVGIGFLYFSGIRGNSDLFLDAGGYRVLGHTYGVTALDRPVSYNRTPLFEYLLGYAWTPWLRAALSYQHQGGISIQTRSRRGIGVSYGGWHDSQIQLRSNLALDALTVKVILETPRALQIGRAAIHPYLGLAVGPGWQSWMNPEIIYSAIDDNAFYYSQPCPLKSKIVANAVFSVDAGMRLQSVLPNDSFSVVGGCKYNQWGQARNIGKIRQQGAPEGLTHPYRIRTVYSFAPYLGFQWNYFTDPSYLPVHCVAGREVNRWKPFFVPVKDLGSEMKSIFTQFNAGIGFLYFSDLRGNILALYENTTVAANMIKIFGALPFQGSLRYNRTPLFEYLLGYQFLPWLKVALSYQHQGGVFIQTPLQKGLGTLAGVFFEVNYSQFRSTLALDAVMPKVYFTLPYVGISKGIAVSPYLAVGVGPSWQSWTDIELEQTYTEDVYNNNQYYLRSEPLPLRNKYIANAAWMLDAGFRFQSAYPDGCFSVTSGCKYNAWGQARNIGKLSQQNMPKRGLAYPFKAEIVYSFAPYLGVEWDFPANVAGLPPCLLEGKNTSRWLPFIANLNPLENDHPVFVNWNVGVGFLYFSGIHGNTAGQYDTPAHTLTLGGTYGQSSFKQHLRYNRTPLFEYILGYEWNRWLQTALSYQHQGGISVQSAMEHGIGGVGGNWSQFRSDLSLDAVMLKVTLQSPMAFICRGVATTPYLGMGVGPGWQSWTNTEEEQTYFFSNRYWNQPLLLRNKYFPNAVFMVDVGLHFQGARPNGSFSVLSGCKYNQWGQTGNIGKPSQQGSVKSGLIHPFYITTLYSFAPYLGVQWNF